MTEIWKDIVGYEGLYQVSNLGRVRSLDRQVEQVSRWGTVVSRKHKGRVLSPAFDGKRRYMFLVLRKDGVSKNELIHRLVAKTFVSCDDFSLDVNHKDGCKTNNCADNLEWCTRSYNLKHALDIGLMASQCKIRRKVELTSDNGERITFQDMISCCKFFNRSKCWLGLKIRQNGNPFRYGKYIICVSERG